MNLAENPGQIEVEMERRQQETEAEQHLVKQAITGLGQEILRVKGQKRRLLVLFLSQTAGGEGLTREEYEARAQKIAAELKQYEDRKSGKLSRIKQNTVSPEQSREALRLLKAILVAGLKTTFEEKRAILRLLDVQVLCNGEVLQLTGSIPTRSIPLAVCRRGLAKRVLTDPIEPKFFSNLCHNGLLSSFPARGNAAGI